ncbi:MAG TPA: ABC transporter ATP-binding protein [Candidatus Saccharimonadales bacterium]|nr:ABC transporter ATP-binding protein [Candidatus Saccharimonadales bacterium]
MHDDTGVVLRTIGLSKRYGSFAALDDLNVEVTRGEVFGYLGPNGAGKTTTIRLLLGLIAPTAGQAEIFGMDAQRQKIQIHKRLAYVPGEATLWPGLTGAETLHLLAQVHGAVDTLYRTKLVRRFQFDVDKKVRTYSKGNRQKINLIAAFATRAEFLLLDEPTAGLDPLMEQAFRECVLEAKHNGQTVFLSSHILDEVEALCDRVGILRAGKLVEVGTLAEMRHLSALTVEATFDSHPPKVNHLQGVSAVKITGNRLTCQVRGSIDGLLHVLAAAHPKSLLSREPSLEELFLSLYGKTDERNIEANNGR